VLDIVHALLKLADGLFARADKIMEQQAVIRIALNSE